MGLDTYLKASNAQSGDNFGKSVAIFKDTIVVGASGEDSNQTTVTNGTTASSDNTATDSGAAYVYKRTGTTWVQEAYLKASNAESNDGFGYAVLVSGDTIAVGAYLEDSNQTAITNGSTSSSNNASTDSGAVYIYKRTGTTWAQEAYIKSSNIDPSDGFGGRIDLSDNTLVVGASSEDSNQTTITNGAGSSTNNSLTDSGAVYIYNRIGSTWSQAAYLKAPNADSGDGFGSSVSVDGNTVIVGATGEDSNQTTITNGSTASSDNSKSNSGAVYIFSR